MKKKVIMIAGIFLVVAAAFMIYFIFSDSSIQPIDTVERDALGSLIGVYDEKILHMEIDTEGKAVFALFDRIEETGGGYSLHIATIENPKIGVAGLNPHCGENGMFGREEIEEIQPAIEEAMREGICIPEGKATPPDTVFSKALGGWYDIVVAMYHDQGHIPLKVKGFVYNRELHKWDAVAGVNVTLGLPIIRASVDHGTGEGHAGDGSANELSLVNAIDYAVRMANAAQKKKGKR